MGLTSAPVAHVERAYLDTVDWRLFRRGEVLVDEQDTAVGRALVLQHRASERSDLRVPTSGRPKEAGELPSSLRARVGRPVAPRAFIEVGQERVVVWPLRLLDDENGKTVAHIDVERVERDHGPNLVRVQLRAVRGYEREARRLKAALDGQADLEAADDPMVVAARLGGLVPGVAPGRHRFGSTLPVLASTPSRPSSSISTRRSLRTKTESAGNSTPSCSTTSGSPFDALGPRCGLRSAGCPST
jgi:hypothetical protein